MRQAFERAAFCRYRPQIVPGLRVCLRRTICRKDNRFRIWRPSWCAVIVRAARELPRFAIGNLQHANLSPAVIPESFVVRFVVEPRVRFHVRAVAEVVRFLGLWCNLILFFFNLSIFKRPLYFHFRQFNFPSNMGA